MAVLFAERAAELARLQEAADVYARGNTALLLAEAAGISNTDARTRSREDVIRALAAAEDVIDALNDVAEQSPFLVGSAVDPGDPTSLSVTVPAGLEIPVGAKIIVDWTGNISPAAPTISDSQSNIYALAVESAITHQYFSDLAAALGPGDNVTITFGEALNNAVMTVYFVTGLAAGAPVDTDTFLGSSGGSVTVAVPVGGLATMVAGFQVVDDKALAEHGPGFIQVGRESHPDARLLYSVYSRMSGSVVYAPTVQATVNYNIAASAWAAA